ncbi:hypothetical protein M2137_002377 [Parabacteroides sp. PFB2-10]|nr:hypothetical protein [Parabacteroides sp. PFB2-10]
MNFHTYPSTKEGILFDNTKKTSDLSLVFSTN